MNKKEQEEYKKLGEKLICVPSGLKRKDGTDIMSWSLREWFEERPEENDTYVEYENTIEEETQDYYLVKEDEEQFFDTEEIDQMLPEHLRESSRN